MTALHQYGGLYTYHNLTLIFKHVLCTETVASTGKGKVQTFIEIYVHLLLSVDHTSPVTECWMLATRSDSVATPVHVSW